MEQSSLVDAVTKEVTMKSLLFLCLSSALFAGTSSYRISMSEDLRIKPDPTQPHTLWVGPAVNVDVDKEGNIYVADPKENRIVMFDRNGAFQRQIGGTGQGPGEFQFLSSIQILEDGSAIAFENQQATNIFTYFNHGFEYQDRKERNDLSLMIQGVSFSPDGSKMGGLAVALDTATGQLVTKSFVADSAFNVLHSWDHDASPSFDPSKISDRAYWIEYLAGRFRITGKGLIGFVTFDGAGNVYTAHGSEYVIKRWDKDLKRYTSFGRKFEPRPRSKAEIEALVAPAHEAIVAALPAQLQNMVNAQVVASAIEKAEIPPIHNPINGIRATDNGMLTVVHELSFLKNTTLIDFFDQNGHYMGAYEHPSSGAGTSMIIKGGYAYVIEANANDDRELVRYKIQFIP